MKTFNMCLLYLFNRYLLIYLYLIRYSVLHVLVKGDSKINLACLILFRNKNFIFVWQVSFIHYTFITYLSPILWLHGLPYVQLFLIHDFLLLLVVFMFFEKKLNWFDLLLLCHTVRNKPLVHSHTRCSSTQIFHYQ